MNGRSAITGPLGIALRGRRRVVMWIEQGELIEETADSAVRDPDDRRGGLNHGRGDPVMSNLASSARQGVRRAGDIRTAVGDRYW